MITAENEYFVRFILLLVRAGTKLLRQIVKNGLKKRKVDLGEFLNEKKESIIKSKQLTKLQRDILYPVSPKVANIEEWDITLLSFIAIEFLSKDLTTTENQAVQKIRGMRNNYQAHTCNAAIDNKTFTLIWSELTLVITTVTHSLSEEEKAEYAVLITSTAVVDFDTAVRELKQLDKSNSYFNSIQTSIENLQHSHEMLHASVSRGFVTVTNELADLKMKIEGTGKSTKTVNTIFGKVNVSAEEDYIVNAAEEILLNATKIRSVDIKTIKTAVKNFVDTFLDDIINSGVILESVDKGSIVLKLICPSVDSLISLIEYFNSDQIAKRLKDISDALSTEVGNKVNLNASINMASLEDAMNKLRLLSTSDEDSDQHVTRKRFCRDKVFNDPIHGQIGFHQLCVRIIDTPQFQRLRFIRQLEACYLVFPGASHNRFEHSLGVCFLAGELLRAIKERQPEANITNNDILCVEIAALCHDLGQGPFSHVFEEQFLPSINPENEWKHEHASVKMFEHMLEANNGRIRRYFETLMPDFEERDITFIKEMIGVPANLDSKIWPYIGRQKNKSFLYEVVANKASGVDVDKWDYLARDSHMLGMKSNFDHNRCIYSARVLTSNGRKQICYRDKTAQDLYDMFYTRMTLHRRAYQHKTKNIIGIMICDALIAADDELMFTGENGVELRMSETINDMVAYTKLTDDVFQMILRSSDIRLKRSRDILNSVLNRDLYDCVAQTQIKGGFLEKMAFKENLFNKIHQKQEDIVEMAENFVVVDVVNLDYGMKNKDPVQNVRFYSKRNVNEALEIDKNQVSFVLPDTFAEQYVRVYCKVVDSYLVDVIEESFAEWCAENNHPQSQGSVLRRNSLK